MKKRAPARKAKPAQRKSVCIVCNKEALGAPVADDPVIMAIRKAKRALNIEKGNRLVVCKADLAEHAKRRKEFEKNLVQYGAIALILVIAVTLLSRTISGFLVALLIGAFMLLLSLAKYFPALAKKEV